MKQFWIVTIIFLINNPSGFASYKPSVITTDNIIPPVELEDCFIQLDTILNDSFRAEIHNLPIDIATIKLGNTIGWYLVDKWNFDYRFGFNGQTKFGEKTPKFLQSFFDENINEPYIIIRMIFRSYHNRLNNIPIDFKDAANYYRKLLKQNSLMTASLNESSVIRRRIRESEFLILNDFKISNTTIGDTLGLETYVNNCKGVKCFLTGKLLELDTLSKDAQLFIFDIACSNRNTVAYDQESTIELHDTIRVNLNDCFNLNFNYPSHNYKYPDDWIKYVNQKYSK